ncbi:MoxR family ATPase [Candidatus Woesearchaeota archaeon]|nr:MoxR family ATPase [Candidatus Woesearchaeota archaeon]
MATKDFWKGSDTYICDPQLAVAFQQARILGKPLLLEGEPGTGKTDLAIQFAASTGCSLFQYPSSSKSSLEDVVARFDQVLYLTDAQMLVLRTQLQQQGASQTLADSPRRIEHREDYLHFGPLAQAYQQKNTVLLIDEIDKAPRHFPNDLLYILSQRRYVIPDTGTVISTTQEDMPTIVITSNREQELPSAFLRRCVYHFIEFPSPESMRAIVAKHHPTVNPTLVQSALQIFYQLRNLHLERLPSTSELLEWIAYVHTTTPGITKKDLEHLPGAGVLLKSVRDQPLRRSIEQHGVYRAQ